MKKVWIVLVPMLTLGTALQGQAGEPGDPSSGTQIDVANTITTVQSQDVQVSSSGGAADSKSNANAQVDIDSTSISDYETRTAPLTSFPPYLPNWTHGGWGTVKAYFPNGPTINDQIYETTFDPENPEDMRELRTVLKDLPHEGLAEAIGGVLNSVAVVVFGSPNKYHHGRGLEIINSVVRDRRPEGKPLLVFIDSNVDMRLLREEGYAYMGKVDVEGDVDRNWDQAYKAAVTEVAAVGRRHSADFRRHERRHGRRERHVPFGCGRVQPGELLAVADRRQGHRHHGRQGQSGPQRRRLPVLSRHGGATPNPGVAVRSNSLPGPPGRDGDSRRGGASCGAHGNGDSGRAGWHSGLCPRMARHGIRPSDSASCI